MSSSKTIFEAYWIYRDLPKNISPEDVPLFIDMQKGLSEEVRLETFNKVSINNELFMKRDWNFRIMTESFGGSWQSLQFNTFSYQLKSFVKNRLRKRCHVERALWCFDLFSTGGYYHWITEIGPRLWVASEHVPPEVPLLIPEYFLSKWKFARHFLDPFNRKIITYCKDEVIEVNQLIFVGQTGGIFNFQDVPIQESTALLKRFYRLREDPAILQKIYISRSNVRKRMVINESQVIALVKLYGYTVVRTEDLSVSDQVNLFSRTTHLISIHGAGLSNMVYMPEGSHIIEIRHRGSNQMLNCFFTLAHTFRHNYYYCFGDDKGDSLTTEVRPEDKSIHADLSMLENILRRLST